MHVGESFVVGRETVLCISAQDVDKAHVCPVLWIPIQIHKSLLQLLQWLPADFTTFFAHKLLHSCSYRR